jgi:hypothetical protein
MGRAREAAQAVEERSWSGAAELEQLQERFARFRSGHARGTRYPQELRQAALGLLGEVAPDALYRACGLSFRQVMAWRSAGRAAPTKEQAAEATKVRVFSVVDAPWPAAPEVTLQLGQWSVSVRLTWRGDACCP